MTDDSMRRLRLNYRSTLLLRYDNIGTVRTGCEWFDRYMVFPWERGGFEIVQNGMTK